MHLAAKLASAQEILPLRTRHRQEMNCQIVHDSIHRRPGWTLSYLLEFGGAAAGFGSVAIAGPWKDKPTVFEFYLLPEFRSKSFDFFEALIAAGGARFFEVQTNETLAMALVLTYARDIATEKIVFADQLTTSLSVVGAHLRAVTPEEQICASLEQRQGGGEWVLEMEGTAAAKGGILFHYNRPYGDIYMEVDEAFRRRGLGSFLVQELKRECYNLGAVPCARCNPTNVASRRTLQRAGFVPVAHILIGSIASDRLQQSIANPDDK
jgi:GNAT superfamily N-acetyltransferase